MNVATAVCGFSRCASALGFTRKPPGARRVRGEVDESTRHRQRGRADAGFQTHLCQRRSVASSWMDPLAGGVEDELDPNG